MDFFFAEQRIRESTRTRSKTLAQKIEDKRRRELEAGAAGINSKGNRPLLFAVAAEEYLRMKEARWEPKTRLIAENNLAHLLPAFGKRLLVDIEAPDIRAYQKARLAGGAAPRTVNIEQGLLRAIMRRFGAWARIQHEVTMLPEQGDIGRKISPEEESILLRECGNSRSRGLFPFVTLAIETGARKNVIRTLQWKWINLTNACIQFGKDKTPSGTGRIIPLNRRALETLKLWAQRFPNRGPEHYVFPAERYGASGDVFEATAYATDPTKPIASIKEAWEGAKERTRYYCPNCSTGKLTGKPKPCSGYVCESCRFETDKLPVGVKCRFHDLKHTAVSRMLDAGVPITKIAKIVGWSPATMVRMSARYGHFGLEDLRDAVETISRPAEGEIDQGSPVNPPGMSESRNGKAN
jgi:integrase